MLEQNQNAFLFSVELFRHWFQPYQRLCVTLFHLHTQIMTAASGVSVVIFYDKDISFIVNLQSALHGKTVATVVSYFSACLIGWIANILMSNATQTSNLRHNVPTMQHV